MRCQTARRFMMERLYESLSLDKIARLETHLERCPACAQEWDDVRHGHQFMSVSRTPAVPPHLDQAVLDAARTTDAQPEPRRGSYRVAKLTAAASFLIVATVSVQLWFNGGSDPALDQQLEIASNLEFDRIETEKTIVRSGQPRSELTSAPARKSGVKVRGPEVRSRKGDSEHFYYAADKTNAADPKKAEALFRTGMTLYDNAFTKIGEEQQTLLKSAVLMLRDVEQKHPRQRYWIALSQILIADSYRALGEPLDAVRTYRRMIGLFPDMEQYCKQARASIVQILLDREEYLGEAERALRQYHTLYPSASEFPSFALAYSGMVQSSSPERAVYWYRQVQDALPAAHPQRMKAQRLTYAVEASIREKHYVKDWLVLGPLQQNVMLEEIGPISDDGESSGILNNLHASKRGVPTAWMRVKSDADIDITGILKESPVQACSFLKTAVYSPEKRTVSFWIGATNGCRLWLNNDHVFGKSWKGSFQRDSLRLQFDLRQGWNDIVLKSYHIESKPEWRFSLIITDMEGHLLNDLIVDPAKTAAITLKQE